MPTLGAGEREIRRGDAFKRVKCRFKAATDIAEMEFRLETGGVSEGCKTRKTRVAPNEGLNKELTPLGGESGVLKVGSVMCRRNSRKRYHVRREEVDLAPMDGMNVLPASLGRGITC